MNRNEQDWRQKLRMAWKFIREKWGFFAIALAIVVIGWTANNGVGVEIPNTNDPQIITVIKVGGWLRVETKVNLPERVINRGHMMKLVEEFKNKEQEGEKE